jgi:hypothetical protein
MMINNGKKNKEDDIYDELSRKLIDMIYEHFPEGYPVDFLKVAQQIGFAYFATVASQLKNDPKLGNVLTPSKMAHMSTHLMNFIGHMFSVEGIAEPATTNE